MVAARLLLIGREWKMKVSATEEYGLRCLMALALAYSEGRDMTISEIAASSNISPAYVAKVVGTLRRAGLVRTLRGSKGGLRLARPPEEITLEEAMGALSSRPQRLHWCLEDNKAQDCGIEGLCNLREVWAFLDQGIRSVLQGLTLASLASPQAITIPQTKMESAT